MSPKKLPPYEDVIKILRYDAKTGEILRTKTLFNSKKGKTGSLTSLGYLHVFIKDKCYMAHRIAWLLYYKEDPNFMIDHINGTITDNRIVNLRKSSVRKNAQNRKTHRLGRLQGAYKNKQNKWISQIQHNNQKFYLGLYSSEKEAHEAYVKKCKELESCKV